MPEKRLNYFNVKKDGVDLATFNHPLEYLSNNFYQLTNFYFKMDIVISNKNSNRVLQPQIYLFLTLNDGRTLCLFIDIKVFEEIRKSLAFHIKKILDIEAKPLLK